MYGNEYSLIGSAMALHILCDASLRGSMRHDSAFAILQTQLLTNRKKFCCNVLCI